VVLLGVVVIYQVRAPLVARHAEGGAGDEVSMLLSPQHSVVLSLGHREALGDFLFAKLLVLYGVSFQNKRSFEATYNYLDTITTLAPKFEKPYLFADTLLTMRPQKPTVEDYIEARRIQERGLAELPYETELWSNAGQFAVYLAPAVLPPDLSREFRRAGYRYLARACELASNNANIPYHCIVAAKMLNRSGQREAMIEMLSRTLAVNDDPEIQKRALAYLGAATDERLRERYAHRNAALETEWKASLPHASRILLSLLGPGPKLGTCAGAAASGTPGCYTTWREWGDGLDRVR
jgi:hypothetical protein